MRTSLVAALALASTSAAGVAATAGPTLLACKFVEGRDMQGVVLLPHLAILRIIWGDGSGGEWTHVKFTGRGVFASMPNSTVVISRDLRTISFKEADEVAKGTCRVAPVATGETAWFAPVLKQPWENP